jgi:transposase-like protein
MGFSEDFKRDLCENILKKKLNVLKVLKALNIPSDTFYEWRNRFSNSLALYNRSGNLYLIDETGVKQLKNELHRLGNNQQGIIYVIY